MKVYMLTEYDLNRLLLMVDRNPKHGENGGSSQALSPDEDMAHDKAHRFYNYQVRTWIDSVKE